MRGKNNVKVSFSKLQFRIVIGLSIFLRTYILSHYWCLEILKYKTSLHIRGSSFIVVTNECLFFIFFFIFILSVINFQNSKDDMFIHKIHFQILSFHMQML